MKGPPLLAPSRRGLLRGGLGLATLMGLGLGRSARAGGSPRNLVVWWNGGGWDPTYVFDPHFEVAGIDRDPASVAATVGGIPIADAESRPSVRGFFERWGSRSCVVNGLAVGSISHDACSRLVLTGLRSGGADLGALVADSAGGDAPLPYVSLGGPRYPGSLGALLTPVGPLLAGVMQDLEPAGVPLSSTREELVVEYLRAEASARAGSGPRLATWQDGLDRYGRLRDHAELLEIGASPSAEELVELGVALLGAGLCRALALESPLPDRIGWDSHQGNDVNQSAAFESSFSNLDALLQRLDADGLLEQTTVVALSEMGRTPVLNTGQGKDHWPYTSALVVGGGVGGGRVLGATDDTLVGRGIDLATGAPDDSQGRLRPEHFLAGLLEHFGGDPATWFPGVQPFTAWRA